MTFRQHLYLFFITLPIATLVLLLGLPIEIVKVCAITLYRLLNVYSLWITYALGPLTSIPYVGNAIISPEELGALEIEGRKQ